MLRGKGQKMGCKGQGQLSGFGKMLGACQKLIGFGH